MFLNLKLKIKNWLERLRILPDSQKKIILWAVVGVIGIVMAFFWITGAVKSLSNTGEDIGQINFPEINIPEIPVFPGSQNSEMEDYVFELYVWPDKDSFNLKNQIFYATDLNSKKLIKIKVIEDTKIYRQISSENKEYYDFQWLYSTLKNWEGPNWQFTVRGILQEDNSILALEIYYQIQ